MGKKISGNLGSSNLLNMFDYSNMIAGFSSAMGGGNKFAKPPKKIKNKKPIFDKTGHVTLESISERREFFLGKSIARIEHELHKYGYTTERRKSNSPGSKAKITIVINSSKERNIGQIQVSPGSKRHGDVPYVKISTKDIGKIKIIGSDSSKYKTDGKEKATLLFRRKFKWNI